MLNTSVAFFKLWKLIYQQLNDRMPGISKWYCTSEFYKDFIVQTFGSKNVFSFTFNMHRKFLLLLHIGRKFHLQASWNVQTNITERTKKVPHAGIAEMWKQILLKKLIGFIL